MRTARALLVLSLLSLPLLADDRARLAELRREARAAYGAKDWARLLAVTREAAALAPENVGALHNLACAEALNGHAKEAAAAAGRLAALQVDTGILEDKDLASVKSDPAFAPVRERFRALAAPAGSASEAFRLPERTLLTEGIAHDPKTGRFFVSSVHERKVVVREKTGKVRDLFPPGRDGVLGILALLADPAARTLWATSAAMPEMHGYATEMEGRSELLRFDLDSGELLARFALTEPGKHNLNDLALDAKGTLFVSDALGGGLWKLPKGGSRLEPFVAPGALTNPQGLAFSRDGKLLYVADYARGLFAVDAATGKAAEVEKGKGTPALAGIDGLVADGDALVAVQNGVRPHRVVRIRLDAGGGHVAGVDTLLRADPRFDEPTLAVKAGGELYLVAASQWPAFSARPFEPARLKEPLVLRIPLR